MAVPMASENKGPPGEAQNQSAFFKLPAEIRNEIYAHAFAKKSTCYRLTLGKITMSAHRMSAHRDGYTPCFIRGHDTTYNGFPSWLVTCKRMKTEAMKLFLRTHTFDYPVRVNPSPFTPPIPMHNTMVFNDGGVRNLRYWDATVLDPLRTPMEIQYGERDRERFKDCLPHLQRLLLQDGILELQWYMVTSAQLFAQESLACAEVWDSSWNSKFRRVKIKVLFPAEHVKDGSKAATDVAAACASRLVGAGGLLTIGDPCATSERPYSLPDPLWARWVVVERKIGASLVGQ